MDLPSETELLHLFEAEPTLLDADVHRAYNTLTYEARAPTGRCTVTLSPGYSEVSLCFAAPALALDLAFDEVERMTALDGDSFRLALRTGGAVVVRLRPVFAVTADLRGVRSSGAAS